MEGIKYDDDEARALLIHQGNVSGAHVWLHTHMAKYYTWINNSFAMIIVALSCVSTILSFISIIEQFNTLPVKIIIGVLGSVVFMTESIRKTFKVVDHITEHISAAKNYLTLYSSALRSTKIRGEIGDGLIFALSDFNDDYYSTFNESPDIWGWLISIYIRNYSAKTGITRGDLCGIHHISTHPQNIEDVKHVGNAARGFMINRLKRDNSFDSA